MYLNVCKQNFHISHVRISQRVSGVLMWNLQHIIFILYLNVCKQNFDISRAHISKSRWSFNVKSSAYYFHMKTKILTDFQICISVPLSNGRVSAIIDASMFCLIRLDKAGRRTFQIHEWAGLFFRCLAGSESFCVSSCSYHLISTFFTVSRMYGSWQEHTPS